jgi:UPF0271 protein
MAKGKSLRSKRNADWRSNENDSFQIHLPPSQSLQGMRGSGGATVLDSTAFYAGVPYTSFATFYTTDLVVKEISHRKRKIVSITDLVETGRLKVYNPSSISVQLVKNAAMRSGDFSRISETDVSVLALAVELKDRCLDVTIISDDYSVENLAGILGMKRVSVMTGGIQRVVEWLIFCPGCGKVFQDRGVSACDVCGSALKRKFKTTIDLSEKTREG